MSKQNENPPSETNNETNSQLEPLEVEIDRQIGDLVPQKARGEVVRRISTTLYAEYFSGPIAHPRHLREYNEISPGAADRIITMAEKNAEHRMDMDRKILGAEIADRKLGMWLGAGTLVLLLVLAFSSALLLDSEIVPGLFLGSAVLGAVGMFVKGRNNGQ